MVRIEPDGQPSLLFVLRAQVDRPIFPKVAPQTSEKVTEGVLVPIPVRAR